MAERSRPTSRARRWLRRVPPALAVIGPGIITANVDNDAGGIATYSQAGAGFGTTLLWALPLAYVFLLFAQELGARMGVVTGKGLADLIRERFGVRTTFWMMLALVAVNVANTVAEFSGVAGALGLFGVPRWVSVPLVAGAVWLLVLRGSARLVERIFLVACVVYFAYVGAGLLAHPDWGEVWRGLLVPHLPRTGAEVTMVVTLVGTTIAPWMQFYLQSSVVAKRVVLEDAWLTRLDVLVGSLVANGVAFFIVVACAATIFRAGGHIEDARDAAAALRPLAGPHASLLFAVGLLNASMFSASVLPLSTTYVVCEAFGWESGMDKRREEAPEFYTLYTGMVVLGAGLVLIPTLPLLKVMLLSQTVNGMLLPFLLILQLLLARDARLMGRYRNGPLLGALGWTLTGVLLVLNAAMLVLGVSVG